MDLEAGELSNSANVENLADVQEGNGNADLILVISQVKVLLHTRNACISYVQLDIMFRSILQITNQYSLSPSR